MHRVKPHLYVFMATPPVCRRCTSAQLLRACSKGSAECSLTKGLRFIHSTKAAWSGTVFYTFLSINQRGSSEAPNRGGVL